MDAHCGKDYKRVRMGIDHPGHKDRVTGHVLGDFSKADHQWLDPLLEAIADNIDMFIKGEDSTFMNKLALAIGDKPADNKPQKKQENKTAPKSQSHIRQARSTTKQDTPKTGPMADMLKKLFSNKDN